MKGDFNSHLEWDGIIKANQTKSAYRPIRHAISDAAKQRDWEQLLDLLNRHKRLVNSVRLDGHSFYTPLHQAAYGAAPLKVVRKLIKLGAWRSLKNAEGETAKDVAERRLQKHLIQVLTPKYWLELQADEMEKIEANFHGLILSRVGHIASSKELWLPQLSVLFENKPGSCWFAVPGMYGGFKFWWNEEESVLMSESWSRIAEGSGQLHQITSHNYELIDQGYV